MMGMRKHRRRIVQRASASLLTILLAAVLVIGCGDPGEKRGAVEARLGQLLAEQNQLRQFLEGDFYGIGDDVTIADLPPFASQPPKVVNVNLISGKLYIPPGVSDKVRAALTEYEPQIVAVFREFGCRGLSLESDRSWIEMNFDSEKIDGHMSWQTLSYPSAAHSGPEMVFKDWYYSAIPFDR